MPIRLPETSSQQPLRRRARTRFRRARLGLKTLGRLPFAVLVRHFLVRLIRGSDNVSSDFQLGAGALLALLAVPGAFQCFLLLDKYSALLNWLRGRLNMDLYVVSAPDKYMFVVIAMAVTGVVTVLKWDRILPDAQDYTNLAPLPIAAHRVLLANACAIAFAVLVVAVAVNVFSVVMLPFFVTSAARPPSIGAMQFAGQHAICVMLASLFAFCAVFAVLGLAAVVLPRRLFQPVSGWLRAVLLVGFVMLLSSGSAGAALIRRLAQSPEIRLLPPMWYLALYQSLQHRATPELAKLAPVAVTAAAAAFVLMILAYAASYRRRYANVLETDRGAPDPPLFRIVPAFFDWFSSPRSGFERAGYRFAVRALMRNESQRLCVSVALGLGWLLAWQGASEAWTRGVWAPDGLPAVSLLAAPLIPAYLLVLGLRLAFELPASVSANWIFRSTLDSREHEAGALARRITLALLVPLVLLPSLALTWWWGGLALATLHTAYVLALSLCLIEVQLSGYRKVPFTCLMPGFRENLPFLCFVQFIGFVAFTEGGAHLERSMLAQPMLFPLLPAAMAAAWWWNQRRLKSAKEAGELEPGLAFENRIVPEVETLNLSGGH